MDKRIREEQDRAYAASLEADQAKRREREQQLVCLWGVWCVCVCVESVVHEHVCGTNTCMLTGTCTSTCIHVCRSQKDINTSFVKHRTFQHVVSLVFRPVLC